MYFSFFKIQCPYCGTKHRMNKRGICPQCGKRYILTENSKVNASRADKAKIGSTVAKAFAEIKSFLSSTNAVQKRFLGILTVMMAVFLVLFVSAMVNLSRLDADVYKSGNERIFVPVIYYSGNTAHCLFHDGKTVELGIGEILQYDSSHDGNIMYLLFSGRITADVDSAKVGDYVIRVDNGKNLEIIAKGESGKVSYLAAADCEYMYCILPKDGTEADGGAAVSTDAAAVPTAQTAEPIGAAGVPEESTATPVDSVEKTVYSLYVTHKRKDMTLITDDLTSANMCVSPNGRYLLYCKADSEGSAITRYRFAKKTSESTGIKNGQPISIDNKGKYFTYVKHDAEGNDNFCYCGFGDTDDKQSYTVEPHIKEIVYSADMHSLAIVYEDGAVFKSGKSGEYRPISFDTGSDFGFMRNEFVKCAAVTDGIIPKISVLEGDLFPFFYYDSPNKTIYRISENGSKIPHFDTAVDDAVISDDGHIAYLSDGTLYSGSLDSGKNRKRLVKESFPYSLYEISPDGKTIFCLDDKTAQLFSMPISGGEADAITENTSFLKLSPDSRIMLYTKGNEVYLRKNAGTPRLTDSGIIPEYTSLITNDFSQFVYARDLGADSEGNNRHSLYIFREGKPMFVTDNLTRFITIESAGFANNRSKHFRASSSESGESSSLLITGSENDSSIQ